VNSWKESALGARKIKPVKKLQKKAVLPPETVFEKARKWVEQNFVTAVGAAAAVLFTVAAVLVYNVYATSKQAHARSDYGVIVSRLPAEGKATSADWEKIIPDLQAFISAHKGTAPALDARIELARALFEVKRYGDAVKVGQESLGLAPPGHGLRPLILYQLGYAYEAAGKLDEAAGEWTSLKELGAHDLEREAYWNLGRIFESKKDFAKAAEMYRLASQTPGDYPPVSLVDQKIAGANGLSPQASK
jgi:tetratricopeptide (TPR) repeat protein